MPVMQAFKCRHPVAPVKCAKYARMNKSPCLVATLVAVLACAVATDAAAQAGSYQQQLALQQRLQAATSLECRFSTVASGTWESGAAQIETRSVAFEMSFTEVNVDEGTADADSQFGPSFIAVRYSSGYLHLMQAFSSGPLYTTTILARETAGGRMMAIHARHEYTPASVPGFTSRPEIYLGDCAIGTEPPAP